MLVISDLHSYFGAAHVLQGVSLEVQEGKLVALLGRNGMGKTTLIRSIMGNEPPTVRGGGIAYRGRELVGRKPFEIASLGLGLVPQGRRIFPSLTVVETLAIASRPVRVGNHSRRIWGQDEVFDFFPSLAERRSHRGSQLSGGERQMLAIGRALMTNPELLLMDEPSEGLAPLLVQHLAERLKDLKETGVTIFLVEQNVGMALALADEVYIIERGRVVYNGHPEELQGDDATKRKFLGV